MTDALPDYLLEPNAVLKDTCTWRYGRAPDYKRMRADYEADKKIDHKPGTFSFLVNNLVKKYGFLLSPFFCIIIFILSSSWEIEASYKVNGREWRTIDPALYQFKSNDGPWLSVDDMLRLGTYNAVIGESEFYSAEKSNFFDSHKTFKRAIRSFAWEVLEVFSELPTVVFTWRHFGLYNGKFTSYHKSGTKIESEPTNELLNWTGMCIARLTPDLRIASLEVYSDPAELFRQMTKNGITVVGAPATEGTQEGAQEGAQQAQAGGISTMRFKFYADHRSMIWKQTL
ncbi:hypothetical protein FISHEDRAFT_57903 [Fistulina hepatica ATCC 64428]|uniref:Uncharacterized protein n=1 Tax=Fistulina hepatica ATCC 64428 TaxID=1128425 RepID=A0A0D7ADV6_9AGAR|nr:hypothetical protein FISHEDRAFT_57903 [Fistulina hepatica ATCC 64428]